MLSVASCELRVAHAHVRFRKTCPTQIRHQARLKQLLLTFPRAAAPMPIIMYAEKWADASVLEETVLGPLANNIEALAHIEKLQREIGSAIDAGSQAALRDWRKICELKHKILQTLEGAPARKRRRDDKTSDVVKVDVEEDRGAEQVVSSDPCSWLGRFVQLTAEAAATKKLPQVPMKVVHVARRRNTKEISVQLQFKHLGHSRTHTDNFPVGTNLTTRYTLMPEEASVQSERFLSDWACQTQAGASLDGKQWGSLAEVLPSFQLKVNAPAPKYTPYIIDTCAPRAGIAAVLATQLRPIELEQVFRASCGHEKFQATAEPLLRKSLACIAERRFMQRILDGEVEAHDGLNRRVGHIELHPWQAAVCGFLLAKLARPEESNMLVETTHTFGTTEETVHISACVPQRVAVLHAATGLGKTFVACFLARGRTVYCIVHPNSTRQWKNEAAKMGLNATWADSLARLSKAADTLNKDPEQTLIISHTLFRTSGFERCNLPAPDLLIIDECHTPFNRPVLDFVRAQRGVFKLGMTATIKTREHRDSIRAVLQLPFLPAATIEVPPSANVARYPEVDFQIRKIKMSFVERSAHDVFEGIGARMELIRAMLFPACAGEEGYAQKVWNNITRKLALANKDLREKLVKILARAARPAAHEAVLVDLLGREMTEALLGQALAVSAPESFDSGPHTSKKIGEVLEQRKKVLGAYTFVSRMISTLDNQPELECPICYESSKDNCIAPCGHWICKECAQEVLSNSCPVCRQSCPSTAWMKLEDAQAKVLEEERGDAEEQNTSGKLEELKRIVGEMGVAERVLVVSPLQCMLWEVKHEMSMLGVELIKLDGSTVDIQNKLRRWQRGDAKGLLAPPVLPALNLPQATMIVFLSPLLEDTEFIQATGRVVRQGSEAAGRGEKVKVVMLCAENTIELNDERRLERFREMAFQISRGEIGQLT